MMERHQIGETLTPAGIAQRMPNVNVGEMTLRQYLALLTAQHTSAAASTPAVGRAVRDAAGMRNLQELAQDLNAKLASGGIMDPLPIAIQLINEADKIVTAGMSDTAKPMTMHDAAKQALNTALTARATGIKPGLATGIPALDAMINGLKPGNLVVLAGRPGMGKTAVGISIGQHIASEGAPVMMASLEMTAADLAERALSALTYKMGHPVAYETIGAGVDLTDADVVALDRALDALKGMPFYIEQRAGISFGQLASSARRYFAKRPGGLLIIDYLGLVKSGDRYKSNRVQEIGEITRACKELGKELGIPVLLLCQLNRGVEGRDDKHPVLQDLRDSGDIEQDADVVIMAYREEYYLRQVSTDDLGGDDLIEHMQALDRSRNVLELGILKQRKGRTGWVKNFCDVSCNVVMGLAR
jgi:replicative DNA helicase